MKSIFKSLMSEFQGKTFPDNTCPVILLSCARNYLLDLKDMNTGSMFYIFQGSNDIWGKILKMVFISEMLIDVYITQEPRTCKPRKTYKYPKNTYIYVKAKCEGKKICKFIYPSDDWQFFVNHLQELRWLSAIHLCFLCQ